MKIGVLALQGDYLNHVAILNKLSVNPVLIRTPDDLDVDGMIIPGGESTTISLLLQSSGLYLPLRGLLNSGMAAFGTCAGMILLAKSVIDGRPDQVSFDAIDIVVRRNGFGRQVASFETELAVSGVGPMKAVFIRAPVVEKVSGEVEVLSSVNYSFPDSADRQVPVICRSGKVLVSSFHPELVGEDRLHRLFLERI
ncbi:MAG: pyridoxal 5'-phosphate synthase glutaminase subunit PdxT [Actinomycetota bacterium]|nr:MAG: pyridoxal 5'-phosphate synthase glutaminase subunit PdxT [Actinomycetota bacterium]